ncbi:MAG TPA: hypothetical protein VGK16_10755 [Candidatus Limnocylindrales bacterium]|jgi:hypothetical protein
MSDTNDELGFIDIGKILRDVTEPPKRRRRTTRTTSSTSDADAAIRRAVRAELDDVKRGLRDLAEEVVRLRRANEALAKEVAKIARTR